MNHSSRLLLGGFFTLSLALAQEPRLVRNASALNAGSFTPSGLPHSGVAAGARAAVLVVDLISEAQEQTTAESLAFAGVTAQIVMGESNRDAYVLLVAPGRIEFLVPADMPTGRGSVRLTVNGKELSAPITIVESAPGIRTLGSLGSGAAVALDSSASEITALHPAVPGDTIRIRTTGLGPITAMANYQIVIGGVAVDIGGLDRLPNGWDDLTFDLPAEAATGCAVPVYLRGSSFLSNFASLPIGAAGAPCQDRNLPSGIDYERIYRDGARIGSVQLARTDLNTMGLKAVGDNGSGTFYRYTQYSVGGAGSVSSSTIGACTLYRALIPENVPTPGFDGLDAGPALTVNGPGGIKNMAAGRQKGVYSGEFGQRIELNLPVPIPQTPLFLDPGTYTVAGAGGADIGAFSAQIRVGSLVTWTNAETFGTACGDSRCVNRSEDLKLDWTGGDSSRTVTVSGIAAVEREYTVFFLCTASADKGTLSVPSLILSALPAVQGSLTFGVQTEPVFFEASGLDWGTLQHSQTYLRQMTLR